MFLQHLFILGKVCSIKWIPSIENILSSSGDIERRKTSLNQDLTDIDDGLLDINRKVDVIRERYLEQFSAMESAVTSLKGTSEYLENMVKSWSKDDN